MEAEASCSTSVRLTLADHMSAVDSSNIRQLLFGGRDSFTRLSLKALFAYDKLPQPPTSEERIRAAGYDELFGNKDRISWKTFRDKLRLKRAASSAGSNVGGNRGLSLRSSPSSVGFDWSMQSTAGSTEQYVNSVDVIGPVPVEPDVFQPVQNNSTHNCGGSECRSGSVMLWTMLAEERQLSGRETALAQEMVEDVEQPARMSLMELLEETDRQMGSAGSGYGMDVKEGFGKEGEHTCCVCMVRHKGAAFIPCGHTFCRMWSRELWVQRGNCPLCNNLIVEVLDIF